MEQQTTQRSVFGFLWDWFIKRGVIFFCIQTPTFAIFAGYFFRITNYPTAMFAVLIAFVVLPVWIVYRLKVSQDPDEPAHHLPKYTLYSLLLAPVFSIVRIPAHIVFGTVFWQPWYDFGSKYSGLPVDQYGSFFAGALINFIHGMVLVMGYYVLFKRHSLINAMLFIFVYFSALYSYAFPFALVGLRTNFIWHAIVWYAHFVMALTAWSMPKFWNNVWPRFGSTMRLTTISAIIIVLLFPYFFAFYRANTWQFPRQHMLDQALFNRQNLVTLKEGPTVIETTNDEARYQYTLRFGPRPYKTYFNASKALDAGPIQVRGTLQFQEQSIAWCFAYVEKLETPNVVWPPDRFSDALQKMEYTDIPVTCVGSIAAAREVPVGSSVDLQWSANGMLIGDREKENKSFSGEKQTQLK